MIQDILDVRLTADLREARGGVYSSSAAADIAKYPDSTYGVFTASARTPTASTS
ncbi:MAG: hypothetical protein R2838_04820 [Caldilineaceae bacterium]